MSTPLPCLENFSRLAWARQFKDACRYACAGGEVYEFPYLRAFAAEWYALTEDNWLLGDAFVSTRSGVSSVYLRGTTEDKRMQLGIPVSNTAIAKPVYVLGSSHNFAHWMFDFLPKLRMWLEDPALRALPLLVDRELKPFHLEYMKLLGVQANQVVTIDYPGSVICRQAFFPTVRREQVLGRPVRTAEQLAFLPRVIPIQAEKDSPRRIYISRRKQSVERQRLVNEEALIPLVEDRGYTIVDLESLSIREQIRLFRGAEEIVSVHGAGLTNTIYAPAGARLVELVSDEFDRGYTPDRWFAHSTRLLGQGYRRVAGPTVSNGEIVVNRKARIDPDRLAEALDWAGGSS